MNKIYMVFAVLVASLMLSTAAFAQGPFTDVPSDHWAYAAVKMLKDNGLLQGYPDNTFRGGQSITRYEMAQVIARVWYKVEEMAASGGVSDEVKAQLEKLAQEFRSELADLGVQVDDIMAALDEQGSEIDRLRSMIHDTNVNGMIRFRTGGFVQNNAAMDANGNPTDLATDIGHDLYGNLNFHFMPNDISKLDFSFVYAETHGMIAGMIPSAGDGIAKPATPPFGNAGTTDTPELDVAKLTVDLTPWVSFFGDTPTFTIGRQYFSFGDFGLTGDNGFWSDYGFRFDTSWGETWDFWAGAYRLDSVSTLGAGLAPSFSYAPTRSYQNTNFVTESDDFVVAGIGYNGPEGTVPGHDYAYHFEFSAVPFGYGQELYFGGSTNFEIPWMADSYWVNGARGEAVWVLNNVSDRDPDDLGLDAISWVADLDIYNNGNTKFVGSYAQISQLEGIPVYANVDNDPFSEWDYTVAASGDAFNISREGKNYFPADFDGWGASLEHTFSNGLFGKVYFYDGNRRNSRFEERPGVLRFMFKYPLYENATIGLDVINGGLTDGLDDTNTLVRGDRKSVV